VKIATTDSWITNPNYTTDSDDEAEAEQLNMHTNLHAWRRDFNRSCNATTAYILGT